MDNEISAVYEALDNMDDYALMAGVKPIGPHKVLTDAIAELEKLRQRVAELEQQLIEVRRAERERCAKVCEDQANEPECPERAMYCAEAIRAME